MALPPELADPRAWPYWLGAAIQVVVAGWILVLAPRDLRHRAFVLLVVGNAGWDLGVGLGLVTTGESSFAYGRAVRHFSLWAEGGLLAFLLVYPRARRGATAATVAVVAAVILAEISFLLRPELYDTWFAGERPGVVGPLALTDLLWLPLICVGAIAILWQARADARHDIAPILVALALLAYPLAIHGYTHLAKGTLVEYLSAGTGYAGVRGTAIRLAGMASVPIAAWGIARLATHPRGRGAALVMAAALGAVVVIDTIPALDAQLSGGFEALVFGLVIAYALARGRLFDIDLKLKVTLRRSAIVAAFVSVFFIATQIAQNLLQGYGPIAGGVAAGLLLFALHPLQRVADRLSEAAMPGVRPTPEYLSARKHDVYRAALEGALADGAITDKEREILTRLQLELGIANVEARAIEDELRRVPV